MPEDPVLGDKNRDHSLGILNKQGIMTDAKADHDIKISPFAVQNLCLADRVAH